MKKIIILMGLIAVTFSAYYGYKELLKGQFFGNYSQQSALRDKAVHGIIFSQVNDVYSSAFYLTAKWTSQLAVNPDASSVKMDVIATQTESARGKKVIATVSMHGITAKGTNTGSLMCRVTRSDITSERPYLWVKINVIIDGQPQPPIIKLLGNFKYDPPGK